MSSAASDVGLAPFGLRIIRAMQPSAARGETAECVALRSSGVWPADVCFSRLRQRDAAGSDCCSGLSPRVVRRRRRLLTAAGCEPEQALRRSRVAAASPREAALLLPRRQLRAAPTLASSRGCTGLARAARPVVLVRSGHPAPSSIDARFASGEQQLGHPVQQIRGVPVIRQPGACRVRWTLPAAWVNLRVAAPRANC